MDELLTALHNATAGIRASCIAVPESNLNGTERKTMDTNSDAIADCGAAIANLLGRLAALVLRLQSLPAADIPGPNPSQGDAGLTRGEEVHCLFKRLDYLLELADAKFMAFRFEVVPDCWRELYVDVRILMFHVGVLRSRMRRMWDEGRRGWVNGNEEEARVGKEVDELVKMLDMALIVAGGGPGRGRELINRLLELLEDAWDALRDNSDRRDTKRFKASHDEYEQHHPTLRRQGETTSFSSAVAFEPPVSCPIERTNDVSMETFQKYIDPSTNPEPVTPIIFTDLMSDWPALTDRPWSNPTYLLSRTFNGRRYVPIEIGRSYVDEGWTQKIVPFKDFLTTYIDPTLSSSSSPSSSTTSTSKQKGYLAQHDLFAQIPSLRNDVLLPDYLWTDPPLHPDPKQNKPKVASPQLNAWFGPAGTITPLHTDSMHNLLCQAVGRKYVRLYSPSCTEAMVPMGIEGGVDMGNTSRIDVGVMEGWDDVGEDDVSEDDEDGQGGGLTEEQTGRFKEAEYWDCVLEPGETLYIPIGWWHYVRSLTVSFSVSFWWN